MPLQIGDFQLGNCIGKGAYGAVYKGLNLQDGEIVAIKQIPLDSSVDLDEVMQEIELLKSLQHTNIVRYISFIKTEENLNIILEFVEDGALTRVMKSGGLPELLVSKYASQMLEGLAFLHSKGVVHCDIKCANILKARDGTIKLTDFGVSQTVRSEEQFKADVVGTPYWMAPEIIQLEGATQASDIWSFGCTVIELLTTKPPYHDLRSMSAMYRIVEDEHPPYPEGISEELRDFFGKIFQKDPPKRASAQELLQHPFIQMARINTTSPTETLPVLNPTAPRTAADLRKCFSLLETQNDGTISTGALKVLLRGLGTSWTERELVVALKKRNITGSITFDEFVSLLEECPMLGEKPLRSAFRSFDKEGTGTIRLSDLKRISSCFGGDTLTPDEFESLKSDILVDSEGRLNYEAWITSLMR